MAKKSQIPWFLPLANKMVKTLMRAGVKLNRTGEMPYVPDDGAWSQERAAPYHPDSGC